MVIKQEVSYYVQMEYESKEWLGTWKSIGAMDMEFEYALESLKRKRETFPDNKFRLVKKFTEHVVDDYYDRKEFYPPEEEEETAYMDSEYNTVVSEGLKRHTR